MIYDFSFTKPNGDPLPLSSLRGKVILVVNTASKCGFTKQYAELENLYRCYRDRGLVIIAVPSNDFGSQEPGTDNEIQQFCQINYGVTFPVVKKEKVKGPEAHPFFAYVTHQLGFASTPLWNFYKYLIDSEGNLVDYFISTTSPDADRVKEAIERCLTKPH